MTEQASAPAGPGVLAHLEADAAAIVARYPQPRSALLPLLHLVQSEQGYVSNEGIDFCARLLALSAAEVAGVATFYTMYKRRPVGKYLVGVCTNTLCAVLGGDAILEELQGHLGIGTDETTDDGAVTLEHLECNAACDYAPVVMVNWEFFDNQTPQSACALVDRLRAGEEVWPSRGAKLTSFTEQERLLAGFYDGRADEGPAAGHASLAGLRIVREQEREEARRPPQAEGGGRPAEPHEGPAVGYGPAGGPSGSDAPAQTSDSDPASPADSGNAGQPGSQAHPGAGPSRPGATGSPGPAHPNRPPRHRPSGGQSGPTRGSGR